METIARGPGRPTKYRLASGAIVPGVTTIVGRFKESGGLLHWAWDCGMQGVDFRRVRDDAADAGTIAHRMIEATLHGEPIDDSDDAKYDPDVLKRANKAHGNFLLWAEQTKLRVTATELPLVSEAHRFGGTLDAIGEVMGTLCLVDWKSSNSVYAEYIAQIAAYVKLYEEHHPGTKLDGAHLVRFGKDCDVFVHHSWGRSVIDDGWEYFRMAREMYDLDKRLKKAAA